MRPGPLSARVLALLGATALLLPRFPSLRYVLVLALAGVVGAALIEGLWLRRSSLGAERRAAAAVSLGEPDLIETRVVSNSPRPLRLELRQTLPELLEPRSLRRAALLRPGETLTLEVPVRGVMRGRAPLPPLAAAAGLFGLVERVVALGGPAEILVLPNLRAVAAIHAKLNSFFLRALGSRMSARLGKGREFDRLREYVPGDEPRDVAWKATARRGKLIVREYRLDRSQDIVVCLDQGHRMEARVAGLSRLDHAVNAAVLLAYVANRMEDRSALLSFATEVRFGVAGGRGSTHLRRFTDFAASVRGGYVHSDYLALATDLRRRLRHRSLVVVLSALPEIDSQPLRRALRMLAPQHLPLVVVLEDPNLRAAAELQPAGAEELGRTLAARDLWLARQQTIREARALGAMVVEAAPVDAGVAAMNAYIEIKRRQRL